MIRACLGTNGPEGYRVYGNQLADDLSKHPNTLFPIDAWTSSTRAGAYQINYRTWYGLAQNWGFQDFSPANQDRAAIDLIRQAGALSDVMAGRLLLSISKCSRQWPILPGVTDKSKSLAFARRMYLAAGGTEL